MLRCTGTRTWDSVRGLPGMSFNSQKTQQKPETSAAKDESKMGSFFFIPKNLEERERGVRTDARTTAQTSLKSAHISLSLYYRGFAY